VSDFEKRSNYNKDAGVVQVKIGFEKPVLEVELNEMQEIQRQRVKDVIQAVVPNGVLHGGTYTYSNGIFKIQEVTAIIEGEIIYIPNLQISAGNDDIIYIRVWEKEITATTVMKAYGNEQGEVIPNYIVDSRVGQETSRRIVLAYDLVKSTESDGAYLKLGKIKSGKFEKEVKEIFKIDELITREEIEGMFIEI
jgi:hypothetical protein